MAGPIILSKLSVRLLGAADTAVVAHLPQAYYIGAVAIAAMLFSCTHHLFNGLRWAPPRQACERAGGIELEFTSWLRHPRDLDSTLR